MALLRGQVRQVGQKVPLVLSSQTTGKLEAEPNTDSNAKGFHSLSSKPWLLNWATKALIGCGPAICPALTLCASI
jgi:hypothetical protein